MYPSRSDNKFPFYLFPKKYTAIGEITQRLNAKYIHIPYILSYDQYPAIAVLVQQADEPFNRGLEDMEIMYVLNSCSKKELRAVICYTWARVILRTENYNRLIKVYGQIGCRSKWERLGHSPNSPNLAPSDSHLFSDLKKALNGRRFGSISEVTQATQ